jgi:N4-gp56 family major capsid protein
MADEVTSAAGSVGELVAAEIVSRDIINAAYANAVMPALVKIADISSQNTLTMEFPKWPLLAAGDLTEGTDAANSAVNTTSVSVTADEAGIMITVSDIVAKSGTANLADYAEELGKALANKIDTDILAEVADFTNSVGTTGVDMTEANFLQAIYTLENGNASGPFAAVLHPIQVDDLRKALSSTTGAIWGGPSAPAGDLGSMASLYGVDIFKSTNCASVNTDADRQGVMMPMGNQSGLAFVMHTGANTEFQRDASLRATEIVVTSVYGDECVNVADNGGVAIITDHE